MPPIWISEITMSKLWRDRASKSPLATVHLAALIAAQQQGIHQRFAQAIVIFYYQDPGLSHATPPTTANLAAAIFISTSLTLMLHPPAAPLAGAGGNDRVKPGSLAGYRGHADLALMGTDHGLHHRQPKAGALGAGGEEGFENLA